MKRTIIIFGIVAAAFGSLSARADEYLNRDKWTWSASSICDPDGQDIAGLEGIHDGYAYTCWHSNFHAASGTPERSNPHWVMIDRGSDTTPFYGIAYTPRQSILNTCCTGYLVYLSDRDLSDTPATSVSDIISQLGSPDYSGSWEASFDDKFVAFQKQSTARYILFVNVSSNSSSSAACAEMNLLAKKHDGGGSSVGSSFNAVKITPADGSTPHRIAIDGTNLNISMSGTAVHMSNSGITVEYEPAEIASFTFENYEFEEGELYYGTKGDIYDNPFDLTVTPADGELFELTQFAIASAVGALPTPNPTCEESVILRRGKTARRNISVAKMAEYATEDAYVVTGLHETTLGEYTLTIPEGFFIDAAGCRSNPLVVNWTLVEDPQDAIDEVKAADDCPTLILRRDGSDLIVGGVTASSHVTLVAASGVTVARVPVSGHGVAVIPVGSLGHGVYLLNANNTTIKITI